MTTPLFSLEEKTALVTGAGSGIGEAIARCFAGQGARVVVADRDTDNGDRVAAAIRDAGGQARFVQLDVTEGAACQQVVTEAAPDILVNNAGIGHVGTILTTTAEDLDRLYAVNVRGVFHCSQAAAAGMIERGGGSIINLASIGGIVGVRDRLAYCTTKFAVVGLTKTMALDHAADGLRVNAICPGRVETPFVQARLKEYPDPEAAYREMSATQPIGRMGRPDEIAACAAFLASDAAPLITGDTLMADGGWSAG